MLDVGCFFRCWALVTFLLSGIALAHAQEAVPQAFPQGRYEPLRAHSPFSLATVQALVAPAGPGFADNWYVSGIARIGDDDFVTIKSRDLSKQFSLYANETDHETQVSLASVNWSDTVGKSTVILRKGTETAKLEFNEAEIHAAPQAAGPKGATRRRAWREPPRRSEGSLFPQPLPQPGAPRSSPCQMRIQPPRRMGGPAPTQPTHHRSQVIQPPQ